MDTEWSDILRFLGFILLVLIGVVIVLRLSILFSPPKSYDPNFTSRSLTGWSNTPKKLAWSRTVEKVSEKTS